MFEGQEHMNPPTGDFFGNYMAEVIDDVDPETADSGRVKVRVFPMMIGLDEAVLPWAVPAMPLFAGAAIDQGSYVVPAKNSKVWVFFAAGDVRSPVYFANAPGMTDGPSGREPEKMVFKSRTGHTFTVNDKSGEEKVEVETAAVHKVTLDDNGNTVTIEHKDGQKIVLTNSNVELGQGTLKQLVNDAFQALFNAHVHEYVGYPGGGPGVRYSTGAPVDPTLPPPVDPGTPPIPPVGTPKGITAAELTSDTKAS